MMEIVSRVLHQGTVRETLHDRKRQSKLIIIEQIGQRILFQRRCFSHMQGAMAMHHGCRTALGFPLQ
jgi:hypothetical protein